jgi:hypothetical protein
MFTSDEFLIEVLPFLKFEKKKTRNISKSSIFWCCVMKVNHRCGRIYGLLLQHRRIDQEIKQEEGGKKQSVLFDAECGADIFLRKTC